MATDDSFNPVRLHEPSPVVDSRAREVFPDLVRVVVLKYHDAFATSIGLIELIAEPADLLGRNARRPRLLRVEPDEPKSRPRSWRHKARQTDDGTRLRPGRP